MSAALLALERALPRGRLLAGDDLELKPYGHDHSVATPSLPLAVVLAGSVSDVVATARWASEYGVPLSPRGAGTGKAGGCVPAPGGVVLSLAGMNRVREVRPEHGWAEVEPGVITGAFRQSVADEYGLFYPPDPASLATCTLGGNVATNAGGPVAVKYGVTRRWVLGLQAVKADGTVIHTGRKQPKQVAGLDLTSLLVGSEGTLAIITGVRLGLAPRPRELATALLPFNSVRTATRAVLHATQSGLSPRALELFDGQTVARAGAAEDSPIDPSWGALLLVEFDGGPGEATASLYRFLEGLRAAPSEVRLASNDAERAAIWDVRRRTSKLVKEGAAGWVTEDIAVPLGALPEMTDRLAAIGDEHDLTVLAYGHAGDGNLHVNVLWDEISGEDRAPAAVDDVMRAALELGGTISGEHGIGLVKRRFLPWEVGAPELDLMAGIKRAFDPKGILNPGKILPTP